MHSKCTHMIFPPDIGEDFSRMRDLQGNIIAADIFTRWKCLSHFADAKLKRGNLVIYFRLLLHKIYGMHYLFPRTNHFPNRHYKNHIFIERIVLLQLHEIFMLNNKQLNILFGFGVNNF